MQECTASINVSARANILSNSLYDTRVPKSITRVIIVLRIKIRTAYQPLTATPKTNLLDSSINSTMLPLGIASYKAKLRQTSDHTKQTFARLLFTRYNTRYLNKSRTANPQTSQQDASSIISLSHYRPFRPRGRRSCPTRHHRTRSSGDNGEVSSGHH